MISVCRPLTASVIKLSALKSNWARVRGDCWALVGGVPALEAEASLIFSTYLWDAEFSDCRWEAKIGWNMRLQEWTRQSALSLLLQRCVYA
jgi:hypothetical protein